MSLKAETEMAMKLLEKDIHEKQDTILSLRRQLEDIKQINLEMYNKLQVMKNHIKLILVFCLFHLMFGNYLTKCFRFEFEFFFSSSEIIYS